MMTKLGPNQSAVLAALEERGQLTAMEAGRIVHERRYGADHGGREFAPACCEFTADDGRAVLSSLRRHGLVKRWQESGLWTLVDAGRPGTIAHGS